MEVREEIFYFCLQQELTSENRGRLLQAARQIAGLVRGLYFTLRGLTLGFCLFVCVCVYAQMIYNSREGETMCLCCMCKQRKIMFHKEQSVRQRFFEYFCGIVEGRVV